MGLALGWGRGVEAKRSFTLHTEQRWSQVWMVAAGSEHGGTGYRFTARGERAPEQDQNGFVNRMSGLSAGWSLQELPCLAARGWREEGWGIDVGGGGRDCGLAWDLGTPGVS